MTLRDEMVPLTTREDGSSLWEDGRPTPAELSVADWLLTTTRANRRTLDLTRPVDLAVIEECLRIALQAPAAHNDQRWHWVVVTDPDRRAALAAMYARSWAASTFNATRRVRRFQRADQVSSRNQDSAQWLAEHLHEAPVLVVPCLTGPRPDDPRLVEAWSQLMRDGGLAGDEPGPIEAAFWGSIYPAVWSFQLALRCRGLGSVMTVMHLASAREAAELLELPAGVTQAGMLPVAYLNRTAFKPAKRLPLESRLSYNTWGTGSPARTVMTSEGAPQ